MKNLILIICLIPLACISQKDTLFTLYSGFIIGTLVSVDNEKILFKDLKGVEKSYPSAEIQKYSKAGVTTTVKPITTQPFHNSPPVASQTVSISDEMDYIKLCLRKHADQYYTGVVMQITGAVVVGGGTALAISGEQPGIPISIVGAGVMFIGYIVVLDSHKWFKRASMGVTGTGAFVRYSF